MDAFLSWGFRLPGGCSSWSLRGKSHRGRHLHATLPRPDPGSSCRAKRLCEQSALETRQEGCGNSQRHHGWGTNYGPGPGVPDPCLCPQRFCKGKHSCRHLRASSPAALCYRSSAAMTLIEDGAPLLSCFRESCWRLEAGHLPR